MNRLVPGSGEFPLRELVRALPPDLPMDVEVPSKDLQVQGIAPVERARLAVKASRDLLQESGVG
jgi:hypothetical protein